MSDRTIPADGIGMHLYTMREPLAEDYPGAVKRLAEIGYRTIGVSGRFGHSAEKIRAFADEAGLRIVLEHVGYNRLTEDWEDALADVRTLGGEWIVVPSLPTELRTPDGFRKAAAAFTASRPLTAGVFEALSGSDELEPRSTTFTPAGGETSTSTAGTEPYEMSVTASSSTGEVSFCARMPTRSGVP